MSPVMPMRTLILLLILCATAVFAIQYSFRPPQEVVVRVVDENNLRIENTQLTAQALSVHLQENYPKVGSTIIVFSAQEDVDALAVIPLVNVAEGLGYRDVIVRTHTTP